MDPISDFGVLMGAAVLGGYLIAGCLMLEDFYRAWKRAGKRKPPQPGASQRGGGGRSET